MRSSAVLHVSCSLCNADESRPAATQNGYTVVQCAKCGFIYLTPRPTPEILINLYNIYHTRNGKDEDSWNSLMERNFRETGAMLGGMLPGRGRLLDIGCGYGYFVEMMQRDGWEASGIEPSESASAFAKAKGLYVQRAILEEADLPDGSFDVVTAFYVLEHLYDPLAALCRIRSLLRPGGVLVLRVPHTTPIVRLLAMLGIGNNLYDLPFHLSDFSPRTLRFALRKAGFSDVRIMPGAPTLPPKQIERIVSAASGIMAKLMYAVGGEALLLPGVSKTAIARNPLELADA